MASIQELLNAQNAAKNRHQKASDWSKRNAQAFGGLLTLNGLMPVTGDIQAGLLAANDVKNGDYGSAALNGIGLLPFVPAMAGMIGKKSDDVGRALTKYEQAHETARQNAVKMLGLPENNTAMDRAKALGFDDGWFHGRYRDYDKIKEGRTFYATQDPSYASIYAVEPTASSMGGKSISDFDNLQPNVMPVMIKKDAVLDTRTPQGKKVFNNDFYMKYGNGTPLTDKGIPDWVDAEDFGEMFSDTGSKFKGVYADEGKIPTWDGGLKDRGVSAAIFNPSAVRSRFAAFDPARVNEPDLLGYADPRILPMLTIGGLLGAGGAYYGSQK